MEKGESPNQHLPQSGNDTTKHKKSYVDVVNKDPNSTAKHGENKPVDLPTNICRRWQKLSSLVEVVPEGINKCDEQEWEEIEMAVNSGATETVVGENMLKNIDTKEGSAYKRGVQYEVASGDLIPNLGEKHFVGVCENGETRTMTAQVCDVNKALLSVKRLSLIHI